MRLPKIPGYTNRVMLGRWLLPWTWRSEPKGILIEPGWFAVTPTGHYPTPRFGSLPVLGSWVDVQR